MALGFFHKRFVSTAVRKWAYNLSGFNKYGLMRDDMWDESLEDVEIALNRLPTEIRDERNFRILRAIQLDIQKKYLPKEEWMKFEDDVRYLKPYLDEVVKERQEKEEWAKKF